MTIETEFGEIAAWGLIAAALVYACFSPGARPGQGGAVAVVAGTAAALATKAPLLDLA